MTGVLCPSWCLSSCLTLWLRRACGKSSSCRLWCVITPDMGVVGGDSAHACRGLGGKSSSCCPDCVDGLPALSPARLALRRVPRRVVALFVVLLTLVLPRLASRCV